MKQSKHNFLYPHVRYRGAVKPEHLVLNANLQEFAQRVPKPAPTSNFSALNALANKLRKFIFLSKVQ
ncbi:hypothetical protein [Coleofasciculus sp. D1-CHI-01]|uniref:hypothetical protein n=1 Tax=Coleofasciculus sp. D1-CHI-01 TaxID=3068482 RepID=UPI00406461A9